MDEWKPGASIRIRSLTAGEYDRYQQATIDRSDLDSKKLNIVGATAMLVSMGCVDDDGKQFFQPTDAAALGQKHPGVIERIANRVAALSGIDRAAVEETEGNSPAGTQDDSDTDSPSPSE